MAGNGERGTMPTRKKITKCMVVGDSIVRNVGVDHADMKAECFPGIKTEQLHRVLEKRDLVSPETLSIHVGTNDLKTNGVMA
jgi:FAD/FMN-containing dehydrogenase